MWSVQPAQLQWQKAGASGILGGEAGLHQSGGGVEPERVVWDQTGQWGLVAAGGRLWSQWTWRGTFDSNQSLQNRTCNLAERGSCRFVKGQQLPKLAGVHIQFTEMEHLNAVLVAVGCRHLANGSSVHV